MKFKLKRILKKEKEKNILDQLSSATLENTPKFSLVTDGKKNCKVLSVYDGDTIDLAIEHFGTIYAFKGRLSGIDTPEMKPPLDVVDRENKLQKAYAAKSFLSGMVLGKVLPIEIIGEEKYGRLLIRIYIEGGTNVCVNDIMILSGHAVPYDGGKKET